MAAPDPTKLARSILAGEARALARAITLAESTRPDHRAVAESIAAALLPQAGSALRLGITGAPGVGKSTFIDAFGRLLIAAGRKVAVLAVDPSSKRGGGSLLGDKTRMPELAKSPRAFIRPSPAGSRLGGVTRRTREAIVLAAAAGFDRVIVETVGVGQSETEIADMVDLFVLLIGPGSGDELQGLKRGILELADLVIVTKADGDLAPAAQRAVADYAHALRLVRPHDTPAVMAVSALEGRNMDDVAAAIEQLASSLAASGETARRRSRQAQDALWSEIGEDLLATLKVDARLAPLLPELQARVAAGTILPAVAARQVIEAFLALARDRVR